MNQAHPILRDRLRLAAESVLFVLGLAAIVTVMSVTP